MIKDLKTWMLLLILCSISLAPPSTWAQQPQQNSNHNGM